MTVRRLFAPAAALALLAALAGCDANQNKSTAATPVQLINAGRDAIARRQARSVTRPPLTRAVLDTVGKPALEATLERSGIFAYLFIEAERRDDEPGRVITWRTEDDITLSFRNGVLIATRGLGGDLMSTAVPLSGDRPGPASGGAREMRLRALDNKEAVLNLRCLLEDLGPETIEIVELRHSTRHLRETCEGPSARSGEALVVNDYWVDSRAGLVWQSRQWAGPDIGYLRFRRLIR